MNRSLTLKNKQQLVLNSELELGESEGKGKGRFFTSRFLEPGIAHYEELGDILITKETLNKFVHTMVGAPVIIDHEDVTDKNVDKLRVGVISRVWFNEFDGWFYCEGILTDSEAIDLIKNQGWNVSCAYSFESVPKDMHNGKKIDLEFVDGEFLHLAIVKNPRYEGANIVVNKNDDDLEWITVKGNHIPIKKGQSKDEAVKEFLEGKQSSTKDGGEKVKIYTEDTYDEFHKKFYKEHDDKWTFQRTTKGYDVHRTNENKKWEFNQDLKKENLDKYLTDEVVKLRLPNIPKKDKKGDTEFQEDTKNLQLFKDKGYEPSDKYNDGYYTNYILKKLDKSDTKDKSGELKGEQTLDDKIKEYENKIPKNYRRNNQTKALWLYKNNYITRSEWEKTRINNSIGDITMTVLNDLTDFIKKVVKNEKEEEMKEVKNEDKRKLIDEVGGILKGKVDDEIIRTVIKKMEEASYEPSEDSKADNEDDEEKEAKNKCKNEDEKEEKIKEKEEKVTENEDEEEDKKEDKEDKAENKKVKNSMKDIVMGGSSQAQIQKLYTSRKERLEEGNKY